MPSLSVIAAPPLPLAQQTVPATVAFPVDAAPQRARENVVRRPVVDSEAIDRYLRRANRPGERTGARGRARQPGAAHPAPSLGLGRPDRDEGAFRAASFAPPETTPSAAFLTQVIAQEVVPNDERERVRTREQGVSAYQAANDRTATYFGPILPFEVRA